MYDTRQPTTATPAPVPTRRGWAAAGLVGAVVGVVGLFFTSGLTIPGYDHQGDNEAFAAAIAGRSWYVWAAQVVTVVAAACLAVFAAGLRRSLAAQEPAGSLVPRLAAAGVWLTVGMLVVGGGISTELYWALEKVQRWDGDTIAARVTWRGTLKNGQELTAHIATFTQVRDGKVFRHATYDCYEAF